MKKFLFVFASALLAVSLTACGDNQAPVERFSPADDAQTLLDSGAFSETLTGIDTQVACARYSVDEATVTGGAVYGSTGATAEELAIFIFDTPDHAQEALKAMGYWLEDQTEAMSTYLPLEVPKLEKAVLEVRGDSILLVVANDYAPVEKFLK